jgi:hypothetical protein
MLLDVFLPEFDGRMRHVITISAPPEHVYTCLRSVNFDHWGFTRALYALRTLPTLLGSPKETWRRFLKERRRPHFTLEDLLTNGFALLGEESGRELVVGTVGRFWRAHGELSATSSERFITPAPPGTAKAAWNFTVGRHRNGGTELGTETRVLCADSGTRWRFRAYWMLIRPFSSLIRREMLAAVRLQAETTCGQISALATR